MKHLGFFYILFWWIYLLCYLNGLAVSQTPRACSSNDRECAGMNESTIVNSSQQVNQALKDDITAVNEKFMKAFKEQDANAVAALYTEDCQLMPPGSDVVVGREDTAKVLGGLITAGAIEVLLDTKEVGLLDQPDYAYERGEYTFLRADKSVFDQGKYVVIWRKTGGIWYLYIDIFNTNLQSLRSEIEAVNRKFMSAFKAQDADAVAALYTEDCRLMPPGLPLVFGREENAKVLQGVMTAGAREVVLDTKEVGPQNQTDYAYERGEYTFFRADKTVFDQGKYVVVWRKIDGIWYQYIDIFNTNLPSQ